MRSIEAPIEATAETRPPGVPGRRFAPTSSVTAFGGATFPETGKARAPTRGAERIVLSEFTDS